MSNLFLLYKFLEVLNVPSKKPLHKQTCTILETGFNQSCLSFNSISIFQKYKMDVFIEFTTKKCANAQTKCRQMKTGMVKTNVRKY
jgi:hypothetical protein